MDVSKYPSWDKTQAYEKYTVVNYQGALFAALVNVPADTPIVDTSKWLMIYKNQAFTNHERFQGLMIEKAAGEGGGGGDIPTLQQIFAKYKNAGLNIQTADNVTPSMVIRGNTGVNTLSPYGIEISGDEYIYIRTTGDSDSYIEISDGILAVLKRRLGMYRVKHAEFDNWVLNANSRGSVTIPLLDSATDDEIIAYRGINLQEATQGGVNRDGCVIQFFQTANNRKSAQVAVRNVSSENAKIKVIVDCLIGTVV